MGRALSRNGDYRNAAPRASTRAAGFASRATRVLALAVALASTPAPDRGAAAAPDPGAHGTILHVSVPAPSLRGTRRSVRVYLPPSYRDADATGRRYPLVVLLHGWPGGDGNWLGEGRAAVTLDSMIATRSIPELIALMPNANGAGFLGRSTYLNAWDGSFSIQDFIVRDLVAWADSAYRTRPDSSQRALVGLSEGGSAAVNLALRHPEVFNACAGLSGEFELRHRFGLGAVLGPEPGASRILEENSPLLYIDRVAARARGQVIYFDCGLAETDVLEQNRDFDRKLQSLGVPHVYREYPGGHGWGYWRVHLRDALLAVTSRWK